MINQIKKYFKRLYFLFYPTFVIKIASEMTPLEKLALINSAEYEGARNVILVEKSKGV